MTDLKLHTEDDQLPEAEPVAGTASTLELKPDETLTEYFMLLEQALEDADAEIAEERKAA